MRNGHDGGAALAPAEDPKISRDLRKTLERLARMHAERDDVVVVNADLNRKEQVVAAVEAATARFSRIDIVVHGAGRIDAAAFASAADTSPAIVEAQFSPKLRGLLYLMEAVRGREPKRWILHSSVSSVLGGLGLGAYAGVNAVLDAMALAGGGSWLSVGWDAWENALEAASEGMPDPITLAEGGDAFLRLIGFEIGSHALVVVNDLGVRVRAWVRRGEGEAQRKSAGPTRHPRPNLSVAFEEPRTETERRLADIWGMQLGLDAVGIHDRFLDLGGHSLLAVQVAAKFAMLSGRASRLAALPGTDGRPAGADHRPRCADSRSSQGANQGRAAPPFDAAERRQFARRDGEGELPRLL
jgi:hypothetical protein